jgi:hypothetical protein
LFWSGGVVLVLLLPAFGFGVLPGPELFGLGLTPTPLVELLGEPLPLTVTLSVTLRLPA